MGLFGKKKSAPAPAPTSSYTPTNASANLFDCSGGVIYSKVFGKNKPFGSLLDIPSTVGTQRVTKIGDHAFSMASAIEKVIIPEGVTEILEYAFVECTSLEEVSFPSTLTRIERKAFARCNLQKARFNGTVGDWCEIEKGDGWIMDVPCLCVRCKNGEVSYDENGNEETLLI